MTLKKENYRNRILKTYSIIVDFDGEPRRENVPSPVEGETFKHWRLRVLGDQVTNVTIHGPWEPPPQTRISTIQRWSKDLPLEKTFKALIADKKKAVKETEAVKRAYVSFPKESLEDLIDELADSTEPAVLEFFQEFLDKTLSEVDTEELLRCLIQRFNDNSRSLRAARGKG